MADSLEGPRFTTARIIAASLAGGVALFWILGWVLTGGGTEGFTPEVLPQDIAFWISFGALVVGFAAALTFRNRAVSLVWGPGRNAGASGTPDGGAVQTNLIISWAMLEGPALLCGVLFLLVADHRILWIATPVHALGVVLTFPRAEWFGDVGARGGAS